MTECGGRVRESDTEVVFGVVGCWLGASVGTAPPSRGIVRYLHTRGPYKISISSCQDQFCLRTIAPFGDAYEKIGTIQRRLAWPLHKDDTLFQSGRPTGLNIYFYLNRTSWRRSFWEAVYLPSVCLNGYVQIMHVDNFNMCLIYDEQLMDCAYYNPHLSKWAYSFLLFFQNCKLWQFQIQCSYDKCWMYHVMKQTRVHQPSSYLCLFTSAVHRSLYIMLNTSCSSFYSSWLNTLQEKQSIFRK